MSPFFNDISYHKIFFRSFHQMDDSMEDRNYLIIKLKLKMFCSENEKPLYNCLKILVRHINILWN